MRGAHLVCGWGGAVQARLESLSLLPPKFDPVGSRYSEKSVTLLCSPLS